MNWANNDTQTLWCRGIPGVGKTILASVAIKHLMDAQKGKEPANNAGVACLYCEYDRRNDQTPQSLLAAFLRQLAEQRSPLIPASVAELYHLHLTDKTQPSIEKISSVLPDIIRSFSEVFLVIDALDECSEGNCMKLLSKLQDLQAKTGIKLLATSRPTVDFRINFEQCTVLEIKANEYDVKTVLDIQIEEKLSKCVRTDHELRNMVKDGITAAADGM